MAVYAVILAAGKGVRFGPGREPKQFRPLLGKPVFLHCLETYAKLTQVDRILLVHRRPYRNKIENLLRRSNLSNRVELVATASRYRQASVASALARLPDEGLMVLQNSVAPATTKRLIQDCLVVAARKNAVSAYVEPFHTVFRVSGSRVQNVIPRSELGYTCDPQVYALPVLKRAFALAARKGWKDLPTVELVRRSGRAVHLVKSDLSNMKLTIPADLKALEAILRTGP